MRKFGKHLTVVVLAVYVFTVISCATNPVTGERELMLMTESEEIALGQEADVQIISTYGLYPDQGLQNYVNEIGQRMATLSHRPHLEWHFRVLDTPVVNAFALPGGYVYITRGTLAHLNSEAELAMVLGHEIGHVTARHGAKMYSRQLLFMGGLIIGSLASETFRKYAPYAAIGVQLLFLKYSRDQERQSDSLGVQYGYAAGYDPGEFKNFFITLSKMKEESGGGLGLPSFLSTHPVTENRIVDVQKEADQVLIDQPRQGELMVQHDAFVQRTNGLVYGENPRQGYVEGNAFYHPDMGFRFTVPARWTVDNTASVVQMAPSSKEAVIQLSIATEPTPRQAFDKAVSESDLSVVSADNTVVNGFNAFAGYCSMSGDDDKKYVVEIVCIAKDNTIFNFVGLSTVDDFDRYRRTFDNTIYSFSRLSDPKALSRKPKRISVVRVGRRMDVDSYLQNTRMEKELYRQLLLINRLNGRDVLRPNSLVKLIK